MMNRWRKAGLAVLVLMAVAAAYPGLTRSEEAFPCVAAENLQTEVAPEAALESLTCMFKKYEGQEVLHLSVGLKNVSDQPQRYRVRIFLDNGKAVAGLVPEQAAKGLVEPGASAEFVYPVIGMTEKPQGVVLTISTVTE
jgi:hypothetical protein